MPTPAAPSEIRLTKLATRILHLLLKPVGDFTSQKSLEIRLADPNTGEPPDQLPEAVFSLYDHKPQLLFESQDLKRHYALTDAGRRLQRQLAPGKAQPAPDDEGDPDGTDEAPRPPTRQKAAKAKGKAAGKSNQKPTGSFEANTAQANGNFHARTKAANGRFAKLNAPTAQTEPSREPDGEQA